jgi:4-amino-4-deoxy-L-arabinose transferase-like glycosyltransferase
MNIGILLIVGVLGLSSVVLYFFLKEKFTLALYITLVLGIGLRVYCALDGRLHDWDERYHALVAKNMVEQPFKPMLYKNPILPYDYKDWSGNHIWLHKQPLALWLMSKSISIFGLNVVAVRLVSIIFSSLLILIIFGIAKELFSKSVGTISAFLFTVNGFVLEIGSGRASTDHVDLTFLFFITLAAWFCILGSKRHSFIFSFFVGFAIGLAVLTKWLPALVIIPIWVLLNFHYKRSFTFILQTLCIISAMIFIISFPWQYYILQTFPIEAQYEFEYNTRHLSEVLGTDHSYFLYNLQHLRIKFGEYLYLPMVVLCVFLFKKWSSSYNFKLLTLWTWIFIPIIFFSFVKTKMPGYILFTVPALYILSAYVFVYFRRKLYNNLYFRSVAFILLFVLPLRYTFERIKPFENNFLNKYNENYDANTIVFNDPYNIETMFFTDCISSYPYVPDQNVIDSLRNTGVKIVIK